MHVGTGLTREPVSVKSQELEHKVTVLEMGGLDSELVATGFWVRKISWRRAWQPTLVFLPRKSHGQRSLMGYSA